MTKKYLKTQTELHTHLMGMLSADEFINFLIDNGMDFIYWPIDKPVNFYIDSPLEIKSLKEIKNNPKLYREIIDCLQISYGRTISYTEGLNNFYKTRRDLIKYLIEIQSDYKNNEQDVKKRIYNDYINRCLRELVDQGVKYVEISYSIRQVMVNFEIADDIKDKIKCRFLLSTDRSNPLSKFKESSKDLKKVLDKNISVGFDIMGEERPLSLEELDYSDDSKSSRSFKRKLEAILDQMINKDNTTLRLHSGETKHSYTNTEKTLDMLDQISKEKQIQIPPPEIRIGHGVYFEENEKYLTLLKKFKCIIEINATSNCALRNIDEYLKIPYKYYLQNDIPIVISTDGHGLYDTTIFKEDLIAQYFAGEDLAHKISSHDEEILEGKLRR